MLDLNNIYCIDCLEGLKQLDDNSIDLIITSPPYNISGFQNVGIRRKTEHCIWNKTIDYNDDSTSDHMNEEEYEKWQIEVLNECFRVLKNDGSMFYNHKLRVKKNKASFPLEWINKSKFIFRQLITWNRKSTVNFDKCRYYPSSEYVFWLIKERKNPRFKLQNETEHKHDTWTIFPKVDKEHPAPFTIELPNNIIPCVAQGEKITVLDPFMGSGTVALSAIQNNCNYIGFEKYQKYVDLANERINKEKTKEN